MLLNQSCGWDVTVLLPIPSAWGQPCCSCPRGFQPLEPGKPSWWLHHSKLSSLLSKLLPGSFTGTGQSQGMIRKKERENFKSVHAFCFPGMILGDLWEARWQLPPCCGFRPLPGSKNIHLIHSPAVGKAELLIPRDGWRFSLYQSESRASPCHRFPV